MVYTQRNLAISQILERLNFDKCNLRNLLTLFSDCLLCSIISLQLLFSDNRFIWSQWICTAQILIITVWWMIFLPLWNTSQSTSHQWCTVFILDTIISMPPYSFNLPLSQARYQGTPRITWACVHFRRYYHQMLDKFLIIQQCASCKNRQLYTAMKIFVLCWLDSNGWEKNCNAPGVGPCHSYAYEPTF